MSASLLETALHLRREGRLAEAADVYAQILKREPRHFEALHGLGILAYQSGRLEEAERLISEAARLNPASAEAAYNRGCLLQKMKRNEEALFCFEQAIALRPRYLEALVNRAGLLSESNRHAEAVQSLDAACALNPKIAEVWSNRGRALQALERHEEALESYGRALQLKPGFADARKNRAFLLISMGRTAEALQELDTLLKANASDADALRARAEIFWFAQRWQEAASAFERYVALRQSDGLALYRLGSAQLQLQRRAAALASFDAAVSILPDDSVLRAARANLLFELERFEEAARDYERLQEEASAPAWIGGYLTLSRAHCCDWRGLEEGRRRIAAAIGAGQFAIDPTGHAILSDSLELQAQAAQIWVREKYPPAREPLWRGERYRHDRIRIAYLSADFRTHATAFLMAGVFEAHDRTRFETVAMSYGSDDSSAMRTRLQKAFDRFIDVRGESDEAAARRLREMEIDIAVDLKGYTAQARPAILMYRPAPVQAHYLGFPGTMSSPAIDYLIADPVVVPESHRPYYSEKIAYLPDTYQCNDSRRPLPDSLPARLEWGLPSTSFVFACFNNNHKIMPDVFDVWMRVLAACPGSVLWLLKDNDAVVRNLRREAGARGVAPDRLVFAPRTDPVQHLARQRLADLFLDTQPYTAHTTASDALWMGLPVLTVAGSTFAGRVAASLNRAVGLSEMTVASLEEYEAMAVMLAHDRAKLAMIRAKLAANRSSEALFDTKRFTRSLESAYLTMWGRQQRGDAPATFAVPEGGL